MSISPYTVIALVMTVLLVGHIVRAIRGYDKRNFEKMLGNLGWVCWDAGIIWVGASLMERSGLLILSSYTNFSSGVFLLPFFIGAILMAISGALISWRLFNKWREGERDSAALPQVESLQHGDYPVRH